MEDVIEVDSPEVVEEGTVIVPNHEWIAVLRDKRADRTETGLYVPESESKKRLNTGIVLAVGEQGVPDFVEVGARLSFSFDALVEIEVDGVEVLMLHKDHIYCRLM